MRFSWLIEVAMSSFSVRRHMHYVRRDILLTAVILKSISCLVGSIGEAAWHDTTKVPVYTPSMWLEDSVATLDAVVEGKAVLEGNSQGRRAVGGRLDDVKVKYGAIEEGCRTSEGGIRLASPYRVNPNSRGIWLLLRAPHGYVAINPTSMPLRQAEWEQVSQQLKLRRELAEPLREHIDGPSLYRTYRDEAQDREVWHGCNVFTHDEDVHCQLYQHGTRILCRDFDRDGRLSFVFRPIRGSDLSFALRCRNERLRSFSWYKSVKKKGVSRTYHTGNTRGLKEEIHWKDGLRHGVSRTWDEKGALLSEVTYEEGFIPPIIRYRGEEPSRARIYRSEDGISYAAPRDIMHGFRVGMTTSEVSQLLKLDFSEGTGVLFRFYLMDRYLHVSFEDGRISKISSGHNGVHVTINPDFER
jgi:hypothetical protein